MGQEQESGEGIQTPGDMLRTFKKMCDAAVKLGCGHYLGEPLRFYDMDFKALVRNARLLQEGKLEVIALSRHVIAARILDYLYGELSKVDVATKYSRADESSLLAKCKHLLDVFGLIPLDLSLIHI